MVVLVAGMKAKTTNPTNHFGSESAVATIKRFPYACETAISVCFTSTVLKNRCCMFYRLDVKQLITFLEAGFTMEWLQTFMAKVVQASHNCVLPSAQEVQNILKPVSR